MTADDVTSRMSLRDVFQGVLHGGPAVLEVAFAQLAQRHATARPFYLGYPVACDLSFPLTDRLRRTGFFNNVGTSAGPPPGAQHAMEPEEVVLDWFSRHVGFNSGDRWGHVTTGGTGGNRAGILTGRTRHQGAVLLHSAAAHHSVRDAGSDFQIPTFQIAVDAAGRMDLASLDTVVGVLTAGKPAGSVPVIVVATYGTTMTEASDDLPGIHDVLDAHHIRRRYVHLDAALSGIPQALDRAGDFHLADSISTSAYKFLAVQEACGIVIGRGPSRNTTPIALTSTINGTETGVRSGLHAAYMLEAIVTCGDTGLRERAYASRRLADHTIDRFTTIGIPAWRNPEAYFTVLTPTPPRLARWTLAHDDDLGLSHIVCVPGRTTDQIDAFCDDWAAALNTAPPPAPGPAPKPRPRANLFAGFPTGGPA